MNEPEPSENVDFWLKHDEELRYVKRVLEAGRNMTNEDRRAAIDIVHALRVMVRERMTP